MEPDTEGQQIAENDRHHGHAEGSPECWDKCGDPDTDPTRPAEEVRTPTGALRDCLGCGGTGIMSVSVTENTATLRECPCRKRHNDGSESA